MDLTSWVIIPFLIGSIGIYSLFKVLQKLRSSAYVQDAVVVITGATSGLGKGKHVNRDFTACSEHPGD